MITLRSVYEPDSATLLLLYNLLLERPQEANISHRAAPPYEEHIGFVWSRPYQHWYIIEVERFRGEPGYEHDGWDAVGAISATKNNEIGIAILKAHQGKGYAAAAITQFLLDHRPLPAIPSQRMGKWIANVAPDNAPSHALFKRLGWKPTQITYTL